ncbi:MAG: hypothetical protein WAV25_00210 [Minisyncoccia bacterium]
MTDQNTQDPQDEINSLIQKVSDMKKDREEINTKLQGSLDSLDTEVDELSKKTDDTIIELNQAETEAGDELDALILEEAKNQDLEEEEDDEDAED